MPRRKMPAMDDWRPVWAAIERRVAAEGWTFTELYQRTDISEPTYRAMREGGQPLRRRDKIRTLLDGLHWRGDSIELILNGGEPVTWEEDLRRSEAKLDRVLRDPHPDPDVQERMRSAALDDVNFRRLTLGLPLVSTDESEPPTVWQLQHPEASDLQGRLMKLESEMLEVRGLLHELTQTVEGLGRQQGGAEGNPRSPAGG